MASMCSTLRAASNVTSTLVWPVSPGLSVPNVQLMELVVVSMAPELLTELIVRPAGKSRVRLVFVELLVVFE